MIEMDRQPQQKSIPTLLKELAEDARGLVRDEVQLAKAETKENVAAMARDLVPIAVGAVLGLVALLMLATAANAALTSLFVKVMSPGVAVWLAPLILAIALGVTAWSMVNRGKAALKRTSLVPEQTKQTLREDKEWIKNKLS